MIFAWPINLFLNISKTFYCRNFFIKDQISFWSQQHQFIKMLSFILKVSWSHRNLGYLSHCCRSLLNANGTLISHLKFGLCRSEKRKKQSKVYNKKKYLWYSFWITIGCTWVVWMQGMFRIQRRHEDWQTYFLLNKIRIPKEEFDLVPFKTFLCSML